MQSCISYTALCLGIDIKSSKEKSLIRNNFEKVQVEILKNHHDEKINVEKKQLWKEKILKKKNFECIKNFSTPFSTRKSVILCLILSSYKNCVILFFFVKF